MTDEQKSAESMVERVARRLMESRGRCDVTEWGEAERNPSVAQALKEARAAIAAMREPTENMLVDAGTMEGYGDERNGCGRFADEDHKDWWQTMIDAALAGGRP